MDVTVLLFLALTVFLAEAGVSLDPNRNVCSRGISSGGCACSFNSNLQTIVNCANRNFTSVPGDLPIGTAELDLKYNFLPEIVAEDFKGMRDLQILDLSNNRISKISKFSLDTLSNLTTIDLANNRLTSVNNDYFYHLPYLQSVDLSRNRIISITGDAFFSLPRINMIKLTGNPLQCDCTMGMFREWVVSLKSPRSVSLLDAECADKRNLSLYDVNFSSCTDLLFQSELPCYSCGTQGTHANCVTKQICGGNKPVCFNKVSYIGDLLSLTKGCDVSVNCLLQESGNAETCFGDKTGQINCHFCCLGNACNNGELGRRTKTLEYVVKLRIDKTLTSDMMNTSSTLYNNFNINVINTISSRFQVLGTSYHVVLNAVGPPATTLFLSIVWTTLTEVDTSNHRNSVIQTLSSLGTIDGSNVDQSSIDVAVKAYCPSETTYNSKGTFSWPSVMFGNTSIIYCPSNFSVVASRFCNGVTRAWDPPNTSACPVVRTSSTRSTGSPSTTTRPTTTKAATFDDLPNGITDGNADYTAMTILKLSENAESFTRDQINETVFVLEELLQLQSTFSAKTRDNNIAMTMSNLLDADQDTFVASESEYGAATRYLNTIDKLTGNVDIQNEDYSDVGKNLAIFASSSPTSNTGITLSTSVPPGDHLESGKINVDKQGNIPNTPSSWLHLPASAFSTGQGNTPNRVTMAAFRNDKLFQIIQQKRKDYLKNSGKRFVNTVNSIVLSAGVPGSDVRNLQEPVRFRFQQNEKNAENASCKFYVESGQNSNTWSDEGCDVTRYVQGEYTECQCDHLTNFALLMDVYGSGAKLSDSELKALTYISYIGAAVSILGLVLTLLTYFMFRKLRTNKPSILLIHFSIVLLSLNLVFLIGQQNYSLESPNGCKAVAVMMHFFILSAFCWMLVEGFYMYRAVSAVFNPDFPHFTLKTCLLGYGLPTVVVAVTLGINSTDNYGKQEGGICWLERVAFYAAFLTPVGLVLLMNVIVFIIVMWKLLRGSSNKEIRAQKAKSQSSDIGKQLRRAMVLVITLGLGWLFAFIAVSRATLPFQIVFTVFNGLQGLFIFIFHCLLNPDVRAHWARIFSSKDEIVSKSKSSDFTDLSKNNSELNLRNKNGQTTETKSKARQYPSYSNHEA